MGSQQLFCLRWSNHQTNMLSVFDQLLQSEALVDVTLACEGLSLRAHRVVLSACSPYFQALFIENPCKHPIVILKDIKYSDLRALVDFMYKGEVNVTQEQLSALLKTAETLKVKGLAEMTSTSSPQQQPLPPIPPQPHLPPHAGVGIIDGNMVAATALSNAVAAAAAAAGSPQSIALASSAGTLSSHHPALQHLPPHHRPSAGSPLAKRKRTARQHQQHQQHQSHHPSASTSGGGGGGASSTSPSHDVSMFDGGGIDDDRSLDIQGSPEVIEAKVEVPPEGYATPRRPTDQDSQMGDDDDARSSDQHHYQMLQHNQSETTPAIELLEDTKPGAFHIASTSAAATASSSSKKNSNSTGGGSSSNNNIDENCSNNGSSGAANSSNNNTNSNNVSARNANPPSAPSSPSLPSLLPSLAPTAPQNTSSSSSALPSTSGTSPAATVSQAHSQSAARMAVSDESDDDSRDSPPPPHANSSSSLFEAIGSQMINRYTPLTIMPINQIGSSVRLEPASPSSNSGEGPGGSGGGRGSSGGSNPKRGQPRILNEEEEALIVQYILEMAARGKPVTRKCVLEYGNMLLRRQDRVPTGSIHCNPEKGLSNDWWKEFKKRHPGLPFRLPVTPNS